MPTIAPHHLADQAAEHPLPVSARRRSGGLPIHVLLVDDHAAVRHGIGKLIAEQPDLVTIAQASSATEATGELARWAEVAVVDYHLGGRDGLWLTRRIKQHESPPRVLIYSAFADGALAAASIIAGADGLLAKSTLDEQLCVAIRRLARGRRHFPAVPASLAAALRARLDPLDQAIFAMLLHGVAEAEIGRRLELSRPELEQHRVDMLRIIAPNAAASSMPAGGHRPLDYDRPRRRPAFPLA